MNAHAIRSELLSEANRKADEKVAQRVRTMRDAEGKNLSQCARELGLSRPALYGILERVRDRR